MLILGIFTDCGFWILAIFLQVFDQQKKIQKEKKYNIFLGLSLLHILYNLTLDVPTAVSLNKLQKRQTNEELIKKITIRNCNQILGPKGLEKFWRIADFRIAIPYRICRGTKDI